MIFIEYLELFQTSAAQSGGTVAADTPCAIEYLAEHRVDRAAPSNWLVVQGCDQVASFEGLAAAPSHCGLSLASMATLRRDPGLPGEFSRGVASDAAEAFESIANTVADRPVATAWLALLIGDAPGAAESITAAATNDAPTSLEWQGAVLVELAAYTDLRVEWSATPRDPVQVALARLLASPGKRRLLAATGRLRLLKPV